MKNYCPIPFFNLEVQGNNARLCCVSGDTYENKEESWVAFWNSKKMNSLRQQMLLPNAKPPQNCSFCFAQESNNIRSLRQDTINSKGVIKIPRRFPSELQLKLSTTCNLKCIMCSAHFSSKWNEDVDAFSRYQKNAVYYPEEKLDLIAVKKIFDDFIAYNKNTAKKITLYGGEPLIHRDFFNYVNTKSKELQTIQLHIFTNGTIFNKTLEMVLPKFKRSVINLSIDGTNDVFNFVRYPAKWDKVTKIIDKFNELATNYKTIELNLVYTISSFSALGLKDFISWAETLGIYYNFRYAITDSYATGVNKSNSYVHPAILDKNLKQKILNDVKNLMNNADYHTLSNVFSQEDFIGEHYKNTFFDYCDLVKEKRKVDFKAIIDNYYA
jgi:MoaA/NifB/PqqE/SkfB family radical SAM enzyme